MILMMKRAIQLGLLLLLSFFGARIITFYDGFSAGPGILSLPSTTAVECLTSKTLYFFERHVLFILGWVVMSVAYALSVIGTTKLLRLTNRLNKFITWLPFFAIFLVSIYPIAEEIFGMSCKILRITP